MTEDMANALLVSYFLCPHLAKEQKGYIISTFQPKLHPKSIHSLYFSVV